MIVVSSWSGGKDSHATLLKAVEQFGTRVIALFCDTGHEHPMTYAHVKAVCEKLGVRLVIVKSSVYADFQDLALKKKRYPSATTRFCTEELKMKPMIDFVLSLTDHVYVFEGKRRDESLARSTLTEHCSFFRYYFEPYKYRVKDKWKHLYCNLPLPTDQLSLFHGPDGFIGKTYDVPIKEVPMEHRQPIYYTYRKKEVLAWVAKYVADIWRPVLHNTSHEVLTMILNAGHRPNPLYFRGMARVGCFPCVMATLWEIWIIISDFPSEWAELKAKEKASGKTFFAPDYIPRWACANREFPRWTTSNATSSARIKTDNCSKNQPQRDSPPAWAFTASANEKTKTDGNHHRTQPRLPYTDLHYRSMEGIPVSR